MAAKILNIPKQGRTLRLPPTADKATTPYVQAWTAPLSFVQPYKYIDWNALNAPGASLPARQTLNGIGQSLMWQNIPLTDFIGNISGGLSSNDAAAQTALELYNGFLNSFNQEAQRTGAVDASLSAEDLAAIEANRQRAMDTFGENGRLAQQQNEYFTQLWNSLANQSNTARVNASNNAGRAGLSANARSIISNQANNQYLQPLADLQKQRTESADALSKSLETLLDKQYGYQTVSNDKYLKGSSDAQAAGRNKIGEALVQFLANNENTNKQAALWPIMQTLLNSLTQTASWTSGTWTTPYNANTIVQNYRNLYK